MDLPRHNWVYLDLTGSNWTILFYCLFTKQCFEKNIFWPKIICMGRAHFNELFNTAYLIINKCCLSLPWKHLEKQKKPMEKCFHLKYMVSNSKEKQQPWNLLWKKLNFFLVTFLNWTIIFKTINLTSDLCYWRRY